MTGKFLGICCKKYFHLPPGRNGCIINHISHLPVIP